MSHGYSDDNSCNASCNPSFADILEARLSRRDLLKSSAALLAMNAIPLGGCATADHGSGTMGFIGISLSTEDAVRVPPGYTATVLYAWGDPIGHTSGSPPFKSAASNSAADQALQAGMHHDGIHYFPLPYGSESSTRGLLAMNHEYTDDGLLHPGGYANWSAEKVRKSQNAMGVGIIE